VLHDRWDCGNRQCGDDYICPLTQDVNREELYELIWWEQDGLEPLILTADRLGICPHCLVTDWGGYIWQAYQWQEAGGDLGVPFTDCPKWLLDAFNLLATERSKANKCKIELDKASR